MRVSIKQIAEMANVSRGTVDRVIHGRYGVSEDVKQCVNKIIKELDYQPNVVARALKTSQKNVVLGVVVPPRDLQFFHEVKKGIQSAEKVYEQCKLKIIYFEMPILDEAGWLAQKEAIFQADIHGLITVAIDTPKICYILDELARRMPVITYNTDFNVSKRLCFVGQAHFVGGRTAGDLMCKTVHKCGDVLLITGVNNVLAHQQRIHGFSEVVRSRCPNLNLIGPFETGERVEVAYRIVSEAVARNKNLTGIFVAGGGAVGAGNALRDSGKAKEIAMICFDLLEETKEHVRSGIVDYTIGQEPYLQGYMPVKLMYELLALAIEPKKEIYNTCIDIRNRENIDYHGFDSYINLF